MTLVGDLARMVHQCRKGRTCSCGGRRLGFRYLLVLGLSLLLFRGVTLVSMGLRSHADTPASTQQQLRAHSEPQQPQLLQQRAEAAEPAAAQQQSAHPMDATTGGHASMHAPTDATADHSATAALPKASAPPGQHAWARGLSVPQQRLVLDKVRSHCGAHLEGEAALIDAARAFVGALPTSDQMAVPRDAAGPWAPSATNYDPPAPALRVLFLTDRSTYTRFSVRTFWHYFFAAAADHRVLARMWGRGFAGYRGDETIVQNLLRHAGGRGSGSGLGFDVVMVGELSAAHSVSFAELRELRGHGVEVGMREHEAWHARHEGLIRDAGVSFVQLPYLADVLTYAPLFRTGALANVSVATVPHYADVGLFSGFGQAARAFVMACGGAGTPACNAAARRMLATPLKRALSERAECDVLLVGSDHEVLYPFRERAKRAVRDASGARGWKVVDRRNPPYVQGGKKQSFDYDGLLRAGDLSRRFPMAGAVARERSMEMHAAAMRRCKLTVVGPSVFSYALAKFTEAAAAGSVAFGPPPNEVGFLHTLGTVGRSVSVGASPEQIAEAVADTLGDRERWETHTTRVQCVAAQRHSPFNMVDALIDGARRARERRFGVVVSEEQWRASERWPCTAVDRNDAKYEIVWDARCSAAAIWQREAPYKWTALFEAERAVSASELGGLQRDGGELRHVGDVLCRQERLAAALPFKSWFTESLKKRVKKAVTKWAKVAARAMGASGAQEARTDDVVAADKARYDQRVHLMPRDGPRLCAEQASCSATGDFPVDLTGWQYKGLEQKKDAKNAQECAQKCCNMGPACLIWQFSDSTSCWVGGKSATQFPDAGHTFQSRGRNMPQPNARTLDNIFGLDRHINRSVCARAVSMPQQQAAPERTPDMVQCSKCQLCALVEGRVCHGCCSRWGRCGNTVDHCFDGIDCKYVEVDSSLVRRVGGLTGGREAPSAYAKLMYDVANDGASRADTSTSDGASLSLSVNTTSGIPKIIHQIWIGDQSRRPTQWMDSWRLKYVAAHPDWTYMEWNDTSIAALFAQHSAHHWAEAALYAQETALEAKADIFRLLAVFLFGGMYIDADSVWLKHDLTSLMDRANQTAMFAALEPGKPWTANGVFGAAPRHPQVRALLGTLRAMLPYYRELRYSYNNEPWKITGPLLMDQVAPHITVLESRYFYPVSWFGIDTTQTDLHEKMHLPDSAYMFQYGLSTNRLANSRSAKGLLTALPTWIACAAIVCAAFMLRARLQAA